jgi:hypothetical protein
MLDDYNLNRMSDRCKVIFERGRFFIESGTPHALKKILGRGNKLLSYIPNYVFERIEHYVADNDKRSAVLLWAKACEEADKWPTRLILASMVFVFHAMIAIVAVYGFVCLYNTP